MMTKRGKYALRALIYLARHRARGLILIHEMAEKEKIPQKFLEAILRDLKNEQLVRSKIGRGGGYELAKPPNKINLGEIIRPIDGSLVPVPCLNHGTRQPCAECPQADHCVIRLIMGEVNTAVAAILDHTTLQMLVHRAEASEQQAIHSLHFVI